MGRVFLILLVLGAIWWGVTSTFFKLYTDPFGMTTRTEMRTQAAVAIANAQANAQIESTRLLADAVKVQAHEELKKTEAWTGVLPLLLVILVGGGAVWLLIMYQGQLLLPLARRSVTLPYLTSLNRENKAQPKSSTLENLKEASEFDPEEALKHYATKHNLAIRQENGYYLLIHQSTKQVVKQLVLKG